MRASLNVRVFWERSTFGGDFFCPLGLIVAGQSVSNRVVQSRLTCYHCLGAWLCSLSVNLSWSVCSLLSVAARQQVTPVDKADHGIFEDLRLAMWVRFTKSQGWRPLYA